MLFEQIQEVVAEHLDCEKDEITRESTFESLGIDSLDAVELVMELEEVLPLLEKSPFSNFVEFDLR